MFDRLYGNEAALNSEHSEQSSVLRSLRLAPEIVKPTQQQPSILQGTHTRIMVNPMQLQEHEFTAWLDRPLEARRN